MNHCYCLFLCLGFPMPLLWSPLFWTSVIIFWYEPYYETLLWFLKHLIWTSDMNHMIWTIWYELFDMTLWCMICYLIPSLIPEPKICFPSHEGNMAMSVMHHWHDSCVGEWFLTPSLFMITIMAIMTLSIWLWDWLWVRGVWVAILDMYV